jgi:uncharacterized membrane protein (GlpM family)
MIIALLIVIAFLLFVIAGKLAPDELAQTIIGVSRVAIFAGVGYGLFLFGVWLFEDRKRASDVLVWAVAVFVCLGFAYACLSWFREGYRRSQPTS